MEIRKKIIHTDILVLYSNLTINWFPVYTVKSRKTNIIYFLSCTLLDNIVTPLYIIVLCISYNWIYIHFSIHR